MDQDDRTEGRARVQAVLWGRLDEAGLQRPKGMTMDGYAGMRARLAERLAYMSHDNLATLAEVIVDAPASRGTCWTEVLIWGEAKALQAPPMAEKRIVTSWLASVEGPPALAGGYAVELFRYLGQHGRAPRAYDMRLIRERGEENGRRKVLIVERIARDVASAEDRSWLEAYRRDEDRVRQIVDEGQAKRDRDAREAVA